MGDNIRKEDSIKVVENDLEAFDKIEPAFIELFKKIQSNVNQVMMENLKLVKAEFGGKLA